MPGKNSEEYKLSFERERTAAFYHDRLGCHVTALGHQDRLMFGKNFITIDIYGKSFIGEPELKKGLWLEVFTGHPIALQEAVLGSDYPDFLGKYLTDEQRRLIWANKIL